MNRLWRWVPLLLAAVLVYVPMSGWKVLYGTEEGDNPAARTYGAEYRVPGFEWAVVLNPDGIRTSDVKLGFYDRCLMRYRGSVREITSHYSWYASLSRDTLVEYTAPPEAPAAGTLCPDGAVFLLPKAELDGFDGRFAEREAYEGQLAAEVQAALSAPRRGAAQVVEDSVHWVEAVNPDGLESFGYRIAFLDVCGIEAGGTVQAIQETAEGTLLAYIPATDASFRGIGIPCPANTVFFEHGPQRHYY
ncbi:MAG TPA: hypothetical protein VKB51_04585 [bacterium]|nr:hypothetical protein [bacterium]